MSDIDYELREFNLVFEPLDDDEVEDIVYWTQCDSVANIDENKFLQILKQNHKELLKRIYNYKDETNNAKEIKGHRNRIQFDLTPRPVSQKQRQQTPKSVRFNLKRHRESLERIERELKGYNSCIGESVCGEQQSLHQTNDDDYDTRGQITSGAPPKTTVRSREVTEEELYDLIPTTFEALDIDIDNLCMPRDGEDDSVSYMSSESGEQQFQTTCLRTGAPNYFGDELQNGFFVNEEGAINGGEEDDNMNEDEVNDTYRAGRRHSERCQANNDSSRPGIKLDYSIIEPERGGRGRGCT